MIGTVAYSPSLREEELKNKVAADWFGAFDCTRIIGNIDFCVDIPATELSLGFEVEPMLWAEAKAGNKKDIVASFVQLILTIGGEHTADKNLPPHFLGAFDAEKIAFLPYNAVLDVLGKNDFDWTVAPSDHESKEFKELYELAKGTIEKNKLLFRFAEACQIRIISPMPSVAPSTIPTFHNSSIGKADKGDNSFCHVLRPKSLQPGWSLPLWVSWISFWSVFCAYSGRFVF